MNDNPLIFCDLILQSSMSHCVSFNILEVELGNVLFEVNFASLSHISLKLFEIFPFLGFT